MLYSLCIAQKLKGLCKTVPEGMKYAWGGGLWIDLEEDGFTVTKTRVLCMFEIFPNKELKSDLKKNFF